MQSSESNNPEVPYNKLLTHVIVSNRNIKDKDSIPINSDELNANYPMIKIIEADINSKKNIFEHDGIKLLNIILKIFNKNN